MRERVIRARMKRARECWWSLWALWSCLLIMDHFILLVECCWFILRVGSLLGLFEADCWLWIISYCFFSVADSYCVFIVDDCFLATGHVCSFLFFHCYFVFPLRLLHVLTHLALGRWIWYCNQRVDVRRILFAPALHISFACWRR